MISIIHLSFHVAIVTSSSAAGSETLIGIKGKDFVLLATSSGISSGNGVAFTSTYIDKIHILQPSYADTQHSMVDTVVTSSAIASASNKSTVITTATSVLNDPSLDDNQSTEHPFSLPRQYKMKIPTIAIAAVGNYADMDHLIRRIRAEYNIYHFESLTYSTSKSIRNIPNEMEIIDCHPNLVQSASSTNRAPSPLHDDDVDDLDAALATVLSVDNVARMVRNQIMTKLRSATPYHTCTLVAGIRPRQQQQFEGVNNDDRDATTVALSSSSATLKNEATTSRHDLGRKLELAEHLQNQVRIATTSKDAIQNESTDTVHDTTTTSKSIDAVDDTTYKSQHESPLAYEPVLYWLDEYGSMIDNIPYGVHGYASDMIYSILDQKYHITLSREEAIQLLNECILQLQTRYMMNTQQQQQSSSSSSLLSRTSIRKSFCIKLIDQYGCTQL
jgi:20S proteasome alpha/beta subunit